jgi:GNAT superfamily N-acetyltransferase
MSYNLEVFGDEKSEAYYQRIRSLSTHWDELTESRRQWWCFRNPRGGAFAFFTFDDEVVATCYLSAKLLNSEEREVPAFEIGETATLPTHQRKGLFSKLVMACVEHAFENGSSVVYGTPNSQSTPGYKKLGFKIVSSPFSWMFIVLNVQYWFPFLAGISKRRSHRDNCSELSLDDYVKKTVNFSRLNVSSNEYLYWRFAETPMKYRFFKASKGANEFLCAVKYGKLGKYPVLVCAEYFLNGRKPPLSQTRPLLRRAVVDSFDVKSYAGIYFHSGKPTSVYRLFLTIFGVLPHRELPVCAKFRNENSNEPDWFKYFQLSDCDIG